MKKHYKYQEEYKELRTDNNWLLLQSCESGQIILSDGSDLTNKPVKKGKQINKKKYKVENKKKGE